MANRAKTITLDLSTAGREHKLTPALWTVWTEAAAVTLERFHAPPPPAKRCTVRAGRSEKNATLAWRPTTKLMRDSHGNALDATEWGAYAITVAALHALDGWRVVARPHHGSGADLVMLHEGDDPDDFVRLEVSGIAAGAGDKAEKALTKRLDEKIAQLGCGDLDRPGVAAVFGFELARVMISKVQR